MRVIKEGKPEIEVTCPACKAVLGVSPEDIRYQTWRSYDDTEEELSAKCCACPAVFKIKPSNIPREWMGHIKATKQ